MGTRPVEVRDLASLHALITRPEVAGWAGHTPLDAPALVARDLARPGVQRLATFDGPRAVAFGEVEPYPRPRTAHVGRLRVLADGVDPGPLAADLVELAFDWLGLSKLEAEVDVEDPVRPALAALGFEVEVHKRAARRRSGALVDAVLLGRFRPGYAPWGPVRPAPEWPAAGPPAEDVRIRPVAPGDLAAWTALHRTPSVVWGTLQLPTGTEADWEKRLGGNDQHGQHAIVAEVDGAIVGSGGLHRLPFPRDHAAGLGMSVHPAWQGRRVGGRILDALVAQGLDALGLARIELEVYTDNPRAVALYRSRGFQVEGVRRANALRAGAHADSYVMAVTAGTAPPRRPAGP